MGLFDIFKVKQYKQEIEKLKKENENIRALLTPEMKELLDIKSEISKMEDRKVLLSSEIEEKIAEVNSLDALIRSRKSQIVILDDEELMQSFGMYTPIYNLMTSEEYKSRINQIKEMQKAMIRNKTATTFPNNWTVDGSQSKGTKFVNDTIKQILRSFNTECDAIIDKVKFNNIESIRNRIVKSFNDLNKLNNICKVSIVPAYLNSKIEELNLCYEYELKKQEEKEEQQRIKEQMREEAKVQKEISLMKDKISKEEKHFSQEIENLKFKLTENGDNEKYLDKIKELEEKLKLLEKDKENVYNREQNTRAGYVYIISNIGSFGENVYKIGMTRRLEPMDRVKELGDASVPFNFDVHAMIFSDDAPTLENELHKYFDNRRLNKVNLKREFFKVSLSEIEQVVKKYHNKTVEFTKLAQAEEYRQSLKINNSYNKETA